MRTVWLFLAGVLVAAQAALAVTDADRTGVYRQFREHFDARRYEQALPLAERLVAMTEEQYGAEARPLVIPLTNLATTQLRLGNHAAAQQNYLRGVEIIESSATTTDRALLRPLHGLGVTYFGVGQYEDAVIALRRAVDLSRNLNGLFNISQLELLVPLIDSYVRLGRFDEADREHQFAFRVAETTYGRDDPRMLGPLDRYARWFEFVGRYTTARALHARALAIAESGAGRGSPLAVDALRGIARTYRLEFLNGMEETGSQDGFASAAVSAADYASAGRLNPDGERALGLALAALEKQEPVDHRRRGETLIDLGDWYMSGGATTKALESYRAAWQDLQQAGATELLGAPRQLAYRPPSSSIARSTLSPEEAEEHFVEVRFTVTREGRPANITIASSNASESLERAVVSALRKARYSPRVVDGQPVDTPGLILRERLVTRRDS